MKHCIVWFSLFIAPYCMAQYTYFSTFFGDIYRVNALDKCSMTIFAHCPYIFTDIAVDKSGRLFLTVNDSLLTMDAANPGAGCILIGRYSNDAPNALEFTADGKLYAAGNNLHEYDPVSNKITLLGSFPRNVSAGGDLVSYNNKLYMSTPDGDLYDINIAAPENSLLYLKINVPNLYGMVVMPVRCFNDTTQKLRVFAFETTGPRSSVAYMIDMETKTTYPNFCKIADGVAGAAAFNPPTINGNQITLAGIVITPSSCRFGNDGSIQVPRDSNSSDNFFYSVDNSHDSNDPIIKNLASGIHTLRKKNQYGCYKDTLVSIPYKKEYCADSIFVPTAFSPNHDKLNDIFRPYSFVSITDYHLQVFNRIGQQIFESRNILKSWDGTFKGILQIPGTYIWQLHYTNLKGNKIILRGFVLLLK
jgi:gliding motility-associated-like protein